MWGLLWLAIKVIGNTAAAFGMGGADVVREREIAIAEAHEDRRDGSGRAFHHFEALAVRRVVPGDGGQDFEHLPEAFLGDFLRAGFEAVLVSPEGFAGGKQDQVRAVFGRELMKPDFRVILGAVRNGVDDVIGLGAENDGFRLGHGGCPFSGFRHGELAASRGAAGIRVGAGGKGSVVAEVIYGEIFELVASIKLRVAFVGVFGFVRGEIFASNFDNDFEGAL